MRKPGTTYIVNRIKNLALQIVIPFKSKKMFMVFSLLLANAIQASTHYIKTPIANHIEEGKMSCYGPYQNLF